MLIRRAGPQDAHAIAAIHVRSWQAAYQEIVPQEFLASLSIDEREARWRRNLEEQRTVTWIAKEDSRATGWVSAGRSRDADATATTAEVWAIYVDPAHWRRGVGRLLWDEAETHLMGSGFGDLTLWVLKDNTAAIAFYEARGMAADPGIEQIVRIGGVDLVEIRLRKRIGV